MKLHLRAYLGLRVYPFPSNIVWLKKYDLYKRLSCAETGTLKHRLYCVETGREVKGGSLRGVTSVRAPD